MKITIELEESHRLLMNRYWFLYTRSLFNMIMMLVHNKNDPSFLHSEMYKKNLKKLIKSAKDYNDIWAGILLIELDKNGYNGSTYKNAYTDSFFRHFFVEV